MLEKANFTISIVIKNFSNNYACITAKINWNGIHVIKILLDVGNYGLVYSITYCKLKLALQFPHQDHKRAFLTNSTSSVVIQLTDSVKKYLNQSVSTGRKVLIKNHIKIPQLRKPTE